MWERRRYRLDRWDVLVLVMAIAAMAWVGFALGLRGFLPSEIAFGVAFLAMALRRSLSPRRDELMYKEVPKPSARRVFAMLGVALGPMICLVGVVLGLVLYGFALKEKMPALLLIPAGVFVVGLVLFVAGRRGMRNEGAAPPPDPHQAILPPTPDQSRGILPP